MQAHRLQGSTSYAQTRAPDEVAFLKERARQQAYTALMAYLVPGLTYTIKVTEETRSRTEYQLRFEEYIYTITVECNVDATLHGYIPSRLNTPVQQQEAPLAGWYPASTLPPIELHMPERDQVASPDVLCYVKQKAPLDDLGCMMLVGWYCFHKKQWVIYGRYMADDVAVLYWTYLPRISLPGVENETAL